VDAIAPCIVLPANISLITFAISSVVCCLHLSESSRSRRANEEKEGGSGKDLDRSKHIRVTAGACVGSSLALRFAPLVQLAAPATILVPGIAFGVSPMPRK
jgi:hypothetical protein